MMGLLSTHIYVFITPQSSSVKGQQGTRHHPCLAVQRHKLLFINSSSRAQCYIGWGKYKQNAHIFSNRNRSRKVCTACSAQENVSLLQNASLPAPRGCLHMAVSRERKEREKERGRERRKKGRGEGRGRKEERKKEGGRKEKEVQALSFYCIKCQLLFHPPKHCLPIHLLKSRILGSCSERSSYRPGKIQQITSRPLEKHKTSPLVKLLKGKKCRCLNSR